jgi:hypothetical protein
MLMHGSSPTNHKWSYSDHLVNTGVVDRALFGDTDHFELDHMLDYD